MIDREEIEFLRKNIEILSLPSTSNESIIEEKQRKKMHKEKNKLNVSKINKKIILDDDNEEIEEKNYENNNEIKQIEKKFDELYDNVYIKDTEYFCQQRTKLFKEVHYDSIECRGIYVPKKKKNKFDINEIIDIIENKGHQGRIESKFEDEFISSDSYDEDIFDMKKINKKYVIKTKQDFLENRDNLNEMIKVINISKN